ncbi:MAG: hypothetical protein K6G08_10485 [Prevotella sp.]|jgi:hypothetical protein|nr:hypothetical protein [Prevotella sp.]
MTNEELYISKKIGKKNPFSVPEGYFDQFADKLMASLPEKQMPVSTATRKTAVMKQLRPWMVAAACLALLILGATVYFYKDNPVAQKQQIAADAAEQQENYIYYSDNYIEDEANYAMFDNQEIYACLLAEM